MYKRDSDRFLLFVFISLVIHVFVFIVFPFGNFSVLGNKGQREDYGFIQLVEYQVEVPKKVNTPPQKIVNKTSEVEEVTPQPSQNETKPEPNRQTEGKKEIDQNSSQSSTPKNNTEVKQELPEPETRVVEKPVEEVEIKNEVESKNTPSQEPEIVQESTEIENNNQEVVTSENSDLEISVSENKKELVAEPTKGTTTPASDEQSNETGGNEDTTPPPPPPPPPPTAGDLILGAPLPAYPKDLVSQTLTGTVELEVHISSTGNVERVEVLTSSDIVEMDRTAQLTLERGWKFKDYKQPYSIIITVEYKMDEDGNPEVEVSHQNLTFK
jgi:protein TonB